MTIVRAELVHAEGSWERGHALVVEGGRILDTGTPADLWKRFPDHDREDWGDVAVLPGTVNAHGHSFQSLLRGIGDDLSFMAWRDQVLYPLSERLDREAIRTGALFDFAEMARAGITTAVDFFYLHDRGNENAMAVVEAAREVGVRLVLARSMYDWTGAPARYQETPMLAERNFRELHAELLADHRLWVQPAPHSIHGASPEMIRTGAALSEDLDVPMHIHVAEGRYERDTSMADHGLTPVAYLDSLGVLSERTLAVHSVWVDDRDLDLMREREIRVCHNPSANAFLGDGVAPLRGMLQRGIPVCLGTDGGCTNNRQSIFEEMRMAALVARAAAADGSALDAATAFRLGTVAGGLALGLPVGRIAAGQAADLVVLDLEALSLQPSDRAPHNVVHSMQPEAIRRVIVGGRTIVEDGQLVTVDESELVSKVRSAVATLQ